ncbi:hypothetical protein MYX04_04445 [Nitrospiraceae bacterium AH_259_D15_M11_P09]|nr:hypothetical protein [Nitrospiraceae bacterium AH_259_D15_M11_P09]
MLEQLTALIGRLKNDPRVPRFDEASTKQAVILPLLQLLGWDTYDIDEVTPEFPVGDNGRVAYALRPGRSTMVFIEVSPPGEELKQPLARLIDHAGQAGAKLAILTNGLGWWFYLPLRADHEGSRQFAAINIAQHDAPQAASAFLNVLSIDRVRSGDAVRRAELLYEARQKKHFLAHILPQAWNRMISGPSELLVDLVAATTENLCGFKPEVAEVRRFLSGHEASFTLPIGGPEMPAPPVTASAPKPSVTEKSRVVLQPARDIEKDRDNAGEETQDVAGYSVIDWAHKLANHPRYGVCQDSDDATALLATLAGQEFDRLPVDDILERAGNVYFLSVKPKQEQQQQLEAHKLHKRGLKVHGIAQKLGISLQRVKKLLTG